MIKASEKASKGLIRDFGELEQLQVSIKGPSDFVTNADTKSEKIIIDELTKSRKNYSILSEESGSKENKDIDNVWIILTYRYLAHCTIKITVSIWSVPLK